MPVRPAVRVLALTLALTLPPVHALVAQQPTGAAQPPRTPRADSLRTANRLDSEGRTAEARAIFTALIASAPTDSARAATTRAMAMSHAFDGDCKAVVRLEEQVIAYWRTREAAEPQNAFYQQGEMANEAARVCIDVGELKEAERLYRLGRELGLKEPAPRTHPASLWDFRTEHAFARLAARRGQAARARAHVEMAKSILAADTVMARDQRRFLPYLEGYVALYLRELPLAEQKLRETIATTGNGNDPFYHYLLAMALEQQGKRDERAPCTRRRTTRRPRTIRRRRSPGARPVASWPEADAPRRRAPLPGHGAARQHQPHWRDAVPAQTLTRSRYVMPAPLRASTITSRAPGDGRA